jgi:hypothetical protein
MVCQASAQNGALEAGATNSARVPYVAEVALSFKQLLN